MKTKIFTILFATLAGISSLFAQSGSCGDNLTWYLSGTTLIISGSGPMQNYSISPDEAPWYEYRSSINTIIINDGVTTIGELAFYLCDALTSITIPNSVTSIGEGAFANCTSLTSIELPNSVTNLESAFYNCSSLTSVIWDITDFPNMSQSYFIDLPIDTIIFGEHVELIPKCMCKDLTQLSYVEIGKSVTAIGYNAFEGCTNLHTIQWNAIACNGFSKVSDSPFASLYHTITSLKFGDEVIYIPSFLCYQHKGLTSIEISNSVERIGKYAFAENSNVTSISIGNSVKYIEEFAFNSCSKLDSVYWNAINCPDLSSYPFSVANLSPALKTFVIGNDVIHIPSYVCYHAANGYNETYSLLSSITIGENVKSIGANAFRGGHSNYHGVTIHWNTNNIDILGESPFTSIGTNLTFTFGESVDHIPARLCYNLYRLYSIIIPSHITSIGNEAFRGSNLSSVTIPESITNIGWKTFSDCENLPVINNLRYADTYLVEAVDKEQTSYMIQDGTRFIGSAAFEDCLNLSEIAIPNSVTNIESEAFRNCNNLRAITLPANTRHLGDMVFYYCGNLNTIICESIIPPVCEYIVDDEKYELISLYVPRESIDDYRTADEWKKFYNIRAIGTEAIDEVSTTKSKPAKLLLDGQVIIQRDDENYTITGAEVK